MSSTGLPSGLAAPLAYAAWWVTGLLFWLIERRDPLVRFHALQAIVVFGPLAALLALIGLGAAYSVTVQPEASSPIVWAAVGSGTAAAGLWGVAMWQAAHGRAWRVPLAGRLVDRILARDAHGAPAHPEGDA
jgi:uncharacterized membrane protein